MVVPPPRRWHALHAEAVQRALASPMRARTTHFVLHILSSRPVVLDIRTAGAPQSPSAVDNLPAAGSTGLGFVIPKRWARRAVTRNLIRRQMREAARRHADRIAPGASVLLRQREPIARGRYPSSASAALRAAVRAELDQLFSQCTNDGT